MGLAIPETSSVEQTVHTENLVRLELLMNKLSQLNRRRLLKAAGMPREVVDAVAGKGITIAATGAWWTGRVIDFARYAESVGASALQVLSPASDEVDVVKQYQDIARQTRLPLALQGNYSIKILKQLVTVDSIVAMKEDVDLDYLIDTVARFGKRINCFAGPYDWFLVGQPYGIKSYFDTYSVFAPEISAQFRKTVQAKDYALQQEINLKYDRAFIAGGEGFQSRWHATLEYFGVAGRYLRQRRHEDFISRADTSRQ